MFISLNNEIKDQIIKKKNFQNLKQECQKKLREMQNIWCQQKVVDLEGFTDAREMSMLERNNYLDQYEHQLDPFLVADNTNTLTDPQDILLRWKEHFSTFLNRNSTTSEDLPRNVPNPPPRL